MLDWDRLRIVDAVARTGTVGGAAQRLHMTSPAVSHQLRRIESELGHAVVEAHGRGVRLTERGRIVAACAREVADLVQRAENDVAAVADEVAGTVRVGAVASSLRDVVAPAVARCRSERPDLRVELVDGESVDHVRGLRDGLLDLVVAGSWNTHPAQVPAGTIVEPVGRQDARVAMPPGVARAVGVAGGRAVSLPDLAGHAWASCRRGSDDHEALVQAARAAGADLDVRYEVADHVTQLRLVALGLAVAVVPSAVDADVDVSGVVFAPVDPPLGRTVHVLRRREEPSAALSALLGALTVAP